MPTAVAEHPRLGGDRLDGVVAVEELGVLEEPERAAAAPAAAHVDADVGVAERREELGERGGVGVARLVAGVLDDRRVGAGVGGAGQHDVDRQRRAVAGLEVAEAAGRQALLGVERRRRQLVERVRRRTVGGRLGLAADRVACRRATSRNSSEPSSSTVPSATTSPSLSTSSSVGARLGVEHGDLLPPRLHGPAAGRGRRRGRSVVVGSVAWSSSPRWS